MDRMRFIFSLGFLCIIAVHTKGKILRSGRNFIATFSLINANSRLNSNCIKNITRRLTPEKCATKCGQERNCQSFNHHIEKGFCELLNITKFDLKKGFDRDLKWKHYETDDDDDMIGERCIGNSECKPYRICEETFQCPGYICKCRDGFNGSKCENYIGAGTTEENPAASCHLLFLRFRAVPDGLYWLKGVKERVNCTRRDDGVYSFWGSFEACSRTCGHGVKIRRRTCTNPLPKGGGSDCSVYGSDTETESCFLKHCKVDGGYSQWSKFSPCRTLCGTGMRYRYRNCSNPYPMYGGKNCSYLGPSEEIKECQSETQCFDIFENNVKYASSYIINTRNATNASTCFKYCVGFPRCNVWSFNKASNECHAMIGVEKKEYAANVVSGFRNITGKFFTQITGDEMVVIENISVETSDNGRAVRRASYYLVATEIFPMIIIYVILLYG